MTRWLAPIIALMLLSLAHANDAPAGYRLVWSDDFSKQADGLPDPAKWSNEVGFIRNKEEQYYTKDRKENARIENGLLVIEARKEEFSNAGSKGPPVAHYTSASLVTEGKGEWQYGRIEVKAKMPAGKGLWPAIWMLGANKTSVGWPACGEVDIMERFGQQLDMVQSTMHFLVEGKHKARSGQVKPVHPEADFHIYTCDWTADHMDFFYDVQKILRFDVKLADTKEGSNPFRLPQFLMLNVALGGTAGGKIDDSVLPRRMSVAYVRVYQKDAP